MAFKQWCGDEKTGKMKLRHTTGKVFAHLLTISGRRRQILCMDAEQVTGLHLNASYQTNLCRYGERVTKDEIVDLGVYMRSLDLVFPKDRPEMDEVSFLDARPYDYTVPERDRVIRD